MGEGAPATTVAPIPRPLGTVRFVLALLVLLWHVDPISDLNRSWLGATGYGAAAVMAFFVLSGFIITAAILRSYRGRPGAFLLNRVIRLWPSYLAALALFVLVLRVTGADAGRGLDWRNLLANALSPFPTAPLTDWLLGLERRDTLLAITWALRAEFGFYLVAGAVLLAGRWAPAGRLPWLLAAVLAASLLGHHLLILSPRLTFYLGLAPHFVLGAVAALFLAGRLERPVALWLAAAALLLGFAHVVFFRLSDLDGPPWRRLPTAANLGGALLWGLVLWWSWRRIGRPRPESLPLDRLLGEQTYNLYLFHLPMILLVAWLWPQPSWLSILPAIALALLVAALFGWLSEPLLRRWRTRVRGQPPA